jgi:hypothetical protein
MSWLVVLTCLLVTLVLRHQKRRHQVEKEAEYERLRLRPGAGRPHWGIPEAILIILGGAFFALLGGLFFYETLARGVERYADRPDLLFLIGLVMSSLSATGIAMAITGITAVRKRAAYAKQENTSPPDADKLRLKCPK